MFAFLIALVLLTLVGAGFVLYVNQQGQITELRREVEHLPTTTVDEIADIARAAQIRTRDLEDRLNRHS